MQLNKLEKIMEAVLFASGDAISAQRLAAVMESDEDVVHRVAARLKEYYDENDSALMVLRLGESYQLCTRPNYAPFIQVALDLRRNQPLSQAALEVLAIIAYNQPVTKAFVEQVRGVDSSGVVNTLVEKALIEEHGRLDLPGRPICYVTTENFLRCFSLSSLDELPEVETADEPGPEIEGQVAFDDRPEDGE